MLLFRAYIPVGFMPASGNRFCGIVSRGILDADAGASSPPAGSHTILITVRSAALRPPARFRTWLLLNLRAHRFPGSGDFRALP